jgi:hypothetical protein
MLYICLGEFILFMYFRKSNTPLKLNKIYYNYIYIYIYSIKIKNLKLKISKLPGNYVPRNCSFLNPTYKSTYIWEHPLKFELCRDRTLNLLIMY